MDANFANLSPHSTLLFSSGADFLFEILEPRDDVFLGLLDAFFELLEATSKVRIGLFEALFDLLKPLFDLLESPVNHAALIGQSTTDSHKKRDE